MCKKISRPWKIIWAYVVLTLDDHQPIHALPVLDECWKFERIWASTSIPIYVRWILAFASQRKSSSLFVIYIGRTCLNWRCREWYLMIFENTLVHKQFMGAPSPNSLVHYCRLVNEFVNINDRHILAHKKRIEHKKYVFLFDLTYELQ